ncbi:MAG: heat-inducible transcriptional repressor HrcA [bacterium]|nr:heat-inducible transcriptional repressor HrcA [bacterium]
MDLSNGLGDYSLSERKRKILQAIIEEYIGTAEPVGSRAISKKKELGLSSATIRNEMADLEDMGYLVQPHTSAGRVPSDSGYRFYVNQLMQKYQLGIEVIARLQEQLHARINQLDRIIRSAGLAASSLTEYTTFITTPGAGNAVINKLDLVYIGIHRIMLIIVTESVRSRLLGADVSQEECSVLTEIINNEFKGKTVSELTKANFDRLLPRVCAAGINKDMFLTVAAFICEAAAEADGGDIVVHNAKSILSYPEYADIDKAREMLEFLEDKEAIRSLIAEDSADTAGYDVRARIGTENKSELLNNCSLVTVNYSLDGKHAGKIGVIGPKRMNYAKVFASLDLISHEIDKVINEFDA